MQVNLCKVLIYIQCKQPVTNDCTYNNIVCVSRSDAQRAAKHKELKEKALEFSGFNAERIEENTNASMVGFSKKVKLL